MNAFSRNCDLLIREKLKSKTRLSEQKSTKVKLFSISFVLYDYDWGYMELFKHT